MVDGVCVSTFDYAVITLLLFICRKSATFMQESDLIMNACV